MKVFDDFDEAKTFIQAVGIEVLEDNSFPTACARWNKNRKKYQILLNPNFVYSHPEKTKILYHEFFHILHGDCIAQEAQESPEAWNIACDMVINEQLKLEDRNCVRLAWSYQTYIGEPAPALYTTGRKQIYEKLKSRKKIQIDDFNGIDIQNTSDKEAKKELDKIRARAVIESGKNRKMKEILRRAGINVQSSPPDNIVIKKPPDNLLKILKTVKNIVQSKKNCSFYRHGRRINNRRGLYPFIKLPKPIISILVFVDVSGSVYNIVEKLIGLGQYMNQKFRVDVIYFADMVAKDYRKAGSGTELRPIEDYINAHLNEYDVFIIVSDFEFWDLYALPKSIQKRLIAVAIGDKGQGFFNLNKHVKGVKWNVD